MKFSIFQMLVFFVCLSIALILAKLPGYASLSIISVVVIIPLFFVLPTDRWRNITYGGLFGIFVCWLIALSVTYFLHIHLPRPPVRSRYDSGIPPEQVEFANRIAPFVVPLGFLVGATATLGYSDWSRERNRRAQQADLTECAHCGRVLSIHSIICPRCERRVQSSGEVVDDVTSD